MTRVATIDVGTNTILLLVAEAGPDGVVRAIDDRIRIERLGRGVDRTRSLEPARVEGALDAIREYARAIEEARVDRVAAVGTQALREATNGAAFLEPAAKILGVPVEVIDGEREAELAFLAVTRSFPVLARGELVVIDVGGGSTEVIVGRGGAIESLVSLPIGSVRMTERYLESDPPSREQTAALIAALDGILAARSLPRGVPLVGTAGTVTSLGAVALRLEPYDAERVQGMRLARTEVERQLATYLGSTLAERKRIVGLDPRRADVIAAGAAIVARVMARIDADEIHVSDRGIRWGLAYRLLGAAEADQ